MAVPTAKAPENRELSRHL